MKYETYNEVMEALRFKEDEMIYRTAQIPNRYKTEEERTRYISAIDAEIKRIKLARRELKRDTENLNRYMAQHCYAKKSRL